MLGKIGNTIRLCSFGSGNDEKMQVSGYVNLELVYCANRLVGFNINSDVYCIKAWEK